MAEKKSGSTTMRPAFEDMQAHYDTSNDFFGLFQDSPWRCRLRRIRDHGVGGSGCPKVAEASGVR